MHDAPTAVPSTFFSSCERNPGAATQCGLAHPHTTRCGPECGQLQGRSSATSQRPNHCNSVKQRCSDNSGPASWVEPDSRPRSPSQKRQAEVSFSPFRHLAGRLLASCYQLPLLFSLSSASICLATLLLLHLSSLLLIPHISHRYPFFFLFYSFVHSWEYLAFSSYVTREACLILRRIVPPPLTHHGWPIALRRPGRRRHRCRWWSRQGLRDFLRLPRCFHRCQRSRRLLQGRG